RPVDRVGLRSPQQIVGGGIFIERQVERGGFFHHHQLDPHRHGVLQELLRDVPDGAEEGDQGKDKQLHNRQKDDRVQRGEDQVPGAKVDRVPVGDVPLVDDDPRDDGVDEQLGGIGGHGGHDTRHHGGGEQSGGDPRAGGPNEPDDLGECRRRTP